MKYLALTLVCLALFVPGLTGLPPVDRDEARYAQATRQMLESGNVIDIRFQDEPRNRKPVGIHWLQAASTLVLGAGDHSRIWTYRIPSLAGAIGAVLLTAWMGTQLFSARAGLLGAAFLAASLLLNVEARLATTDAALLACIVAVQSALLRAYLLGVVRERDRLVFWGALGVGTLLKGPVAVAVCGGTILALFLVERRLTWLRRLASWRGAALLLAITVPWMVAIAYRERDAFFAEWIGRDVIGKIVVGQEGHFAPPGYHVLLFPLAFWPCSLFACLAVPWIWQGRRRPEVRFCLAWILPTWLLFELAATKLPHYVLPLYPAIAILTGAAVMDGAAASMAERWPRVTRLAVGVWIAVACVIAGGLAGAAAALDGRMDWMAVAAAVILLGTIGSSTVLFRRQPPVLAAAALLLAALTGYLTAFARVLPYAESVWVSARVASMMQRTHPCPESTVAAADFHEPSLVFLLGTRTRLVNAELAARHLLDDPQCGMALVASGNTTGFDAMLAAAGASAATVGHVEGINYSKGVRVSLTLYKLADSARR